MGRCRFFRHHSPLAVICRTMFLPCRDRPHTWVRPRKSNVVPPVSGWRWCGGDENARPVAEPQAQHHGIEYALLITHTRYFIDDHHFRLRPRDDSGSSPEKNTHIAPFGHSSRRREDTQRGRGSRPQVANIPLLPSTLTSWKSVVVGAMKCMRFIPART